VQKPNSLLAKIPASLILIDKSYAKGKKIRTGKSMGQIALRALF